jgi:hypothetical protein
VNGIVSGSCLVTGLFRDLRQHCYSLNWLLRYKINPVAKT